MSPRPKVNRDDSSSSPVVSLPRALSKLGFCSRSQAEIYITAGKVQVNGKVVRLPTQRVHLSRDRITVENKEITRSEFVYFMLNKPRGLVTTTADEQGRPTVFQCVEGAQLPRVTPVGRLDQASEGLLLFTNDTQWANRVTSPATHLPKTYHVQVNCVPSDDQLRQCLRGVPSGADLLRCSAIRVLRTGQKNSWLEVTLEEGRNRHIRRMLEGINIEVLRLLRISIGSIQLGTLPKGAFRKLTADEVRALA